MTKNNQTENELDNLKPITNFFYELGQLKRVDRSGWWLLGIKNPENVAEHSFRASAIGWFLARLEKANSEKTAMMCLFNDLHESRVNDMHKVGQRYVNFREAETKAHREQTANLGEIGKEIFSLHKEFQEQKTKEAVIARDADLLENAVQAREYIHRGLTDAQDWLDNIRKIIRTETGMKLLNELEKTSPNQWWQGLKKIER